VFSNKKVFYQELFRAFATRFFVFFGAAAKRSCRAEKNEKSSDRPLNHGYIEVLHFKYLSIPLKFVILKKHLTRVFLLHSDNCGIINLVKIILKKIKKENISKM